MAIRRFTWVGLAVMAAALSGSAAAAELKVLAGAASDGCCRKGRRCRTVGEIERAI
jgi:hypothetical protein